MKGSTLHSMLTWAMRDLARRPGEAVLTGLVVCALVTVTATTLLLVEAWTTTATTLIEEGPSLVVRRVTSGGWAPIPVDEAVAAAASVVGVTDAQPRIRGVVTAPEGPITVMGVTPSQAANLEVAGITLPGPGEIILGAGVPASTTEPLLELLGSTHMKFRIATLLDDAVSLTLHDVALLNVADARALLGLAPNEASDLAVTVFHEAEEEAILPDLTAAFPFPVRITTRGEAAGAAVAGLSRDGGLAMLLLVPATLAMILLLISALRGWNGSRREIGLYKSFGWTTGDLVRLSLFKSLATGIPGVLTGLAAAWGLVLWPGTTWPGALLLGWQTPPPPLFLTPGGATVVLLTVAGLVLIPWVLASMVPAVKSALADPDDLVRGGEQ